MKKPALNMETMKFIGGALIVGAAALIMFPGIMSILMGLSRILILLVVVGGGCLALTLASRRILKLKDNQSELTVKNAITSTELQGNNSTETTSQNQAGA